MEPNVNDVFAAAAAADTEEMNSQQSPEAEERTIPGVRVLFTNGQTFDLPTISQLDEPEPTYDSIMERFRNEEWLRLGASNISIKTATVSAVSEIRIKVVEGGTEQQAENPA